MYTYSVVTGLIYYFFIFSCNEYLYPDGIGTQDLVHCSTHALTTMPMWLPFPLPQ